MKFARAMSLISRSGLAGVTRVADLTRVADVTRMAALSGVAVALLGLAACGFRLAGSDALPAILARPYLSFKDPYTDFAREFEHQLKSSGATVQEIRAKSTATFPSVARAPNRSSKRALPCREGQLLHEIAKHVGITYEYLAPFEGASAPYPSQARPSA